MSILYLGLYPSSRMTISLSRMSVVWGFVCVMTSALGVSSEGMFSREPMDKVNYSKYFLGSPPGSYT